MKPLVFLGPTLPADEARAIVDADFRGPVSQGDVLRAVHQRPPAIAIIDGFFERCPAVWHKEILFALSEGIPVAGASSMGALRAAECDAFGMLGVGAVYEGFRDGLLTDDDEVAVWHGLGTSGFVSLSHAMVNIRATLADAVDQGVVTASAALAIAGTAKRQHYKERRLDTALEECALPEREIAPLRDAWPALYRDVKREDARLLLSQVAAGLPRPVPTFIFEDTNLWRALQSSCSDGNRDNASRPDLLLDTLRLDPPRYREVRERAELRALALATPAGKHAVRGDELAREVIAFRQRCSLWDEADVDGWESERGLEREATLNIVRRDARVGAARAAIRPSVVESIADILYTGDAYADLIATSRAQQNAAEHDRDTVVHHEPIDILTPWFVNEFLRPYGLTLAAYVDAVDVRDEAHLVKLIRLARSRHRLSA